MAAVLQSLLSLVVVATTQPPSPTAPSPPQMVASSLPMSPSDPQLSPCTYWEDQYRTQRWSWLMVCWKPVLTFLNTCTSCVLLLFLPPDLPDPVVEISPDPATATAGGDLVLTCTVTVEEHLVVQPTVEWSGGSVGSESVSVEYIVRDGATSTRQTTFSPLHTSDGGQYVCQADIDIPSIGLMRTASSSRDVTVQSEWLYITFCQSILSLHAHIPTQSPVQW